MTRQELRALVALIYNEIDKMLRARHSQASRVVTLLQLGHYIVALAQAELQEQSEEPNE